jgi:hypothetical protein
MRKRFHISTVLALVAQALIVLTPPGYAHGNSSIDIAAWVAHWPTRFRVAGGKSEPTYIEAIDETRAGDVFSTQGGAPAWEQRASETVSVSATGVIRHLACPKGMDCRTDTLGISFLSSALLLAAFRAHRPLGRAMPVRYGNREVICMPAERLGITEAIFDPCFDLEAGAVLAQRDRRTGRFGGPSLDPGSMRIWSNARTDVGAMTLHQGGKS